MYHATLKSRLPFPGVLAWYWSKTSLSLKPCVLETRLWSSIFLAMKNCIERGISCHFKLKASLSGWFCSILKILATWKDPILPGWPGNIAMLPGLVKREKIYISSLKLVCAARKAILSLPGDIRLSPSLPGCQQSSWKKWNHVHFFNEIGLYSMKSNSKPSRWH